MDLSEQYYDTYTVFDNTASYSTYTVYDDDVYARPYNTYEALASKHYMWYNMHMYAHIIMMWVMCVPVHKLSHGEWQLDRWHCASEISGTVYTMPIKIQLLDSTPIIGKNGKKSICLVPLCQLSQPY